MLRRPFAGLALALAAFFAAVEDLPLMPGLAEVPGAATVFDKPEGRIIQLTATGRVEQGQVLKFYDDALPQLGWQKAGAGDWRREEEMLRLEVHPRGRDSELHISIAPSKSR